MNQRIEKMMEQKAKITEEQMKQAQAEVINSVMIVINVIIGFSFICELYVIYTVKCISFRPPFISCSVRIII